LKDNGIYPWLFYLILFILFVFLTVRLLDDFAFGEWVYALIGFSLSLPLVDSQRLGFLKQITEDRHFFYLKLIEQSIVLFPFIIGLFIFRHYLAAIVLICAGVYLSLRKSNFHLPYSIPTPFGGQPFEFPSGFRKTLILILLAYGLLFIGLRVDNFNLALASIAGIGFIVGGFHSSPEPRFYIWIFKNTPAHFLRNKGLIILKYMSVLILPIMITLVCFDYAKVVLVIFIAVAAFCFAIMCMLSKYISYPQEINIIQGLAMGAAILFPPVMIAIIPWFYIKALRRLQPILK